MCAADLPIVLIEKDPAQADEIRDALSSRGGLVHVEESVHSVDFDAMIGGPCIVLFDIDNSDLREADIRAVVEAISAGKVIRAVILMEMSLLPEGLELLCDIRVKLLLKPFAADELLAALDT